MCSTMFIVREFIAKNDIIIIDYPAYSPDLGPSNFLFPKVKIIMRGERFKDVENKMRNVEASEGSIKE